MKPRLRNGLLLAAAAFALLAAARALHRGRRDPAAPEVPEPPAVETTRVFRENAVWRLDHRAKARLLVVGGGGGGGAECGGGGGGGGVVETPEIVLEPGRYRIRVGRGGEGGVSSGAQNSEQGSNGEPSSIAFRLPGGEERVISLALGGGGGGGWRGTESDKVGRPGASGGGGGIAHAGGAALPGPDGAPQGHEGASSTTASGEPPRPGGGGGAGGPPTPMLVTDRKNAGRSGSGGPGVTTAITGKAEVYGAGGGGGAYNDGPGRAGGPGAGAGMAQSAASVHPYKGRNGSGGGGGGGNNELIRGAYRGADGGNGIVIVRFLPIGPVVREPENAQAVEEPPADASREDGRRRRTARPSPRPLPVLVRQLRDAVLPGILRRPFF